MRYPASEKLEIIRMVEGSHLPTKLTLDMLGIPRTTFYRWYAHYRLYGEDALQGDVMAERKHLETRDERGQYNRGDNEVVHFSTSFSPASTMSVRSVREVR